MTLARNWRFCAINNTGQTLAVTGSDALAITYRGVKRDGSYQATEQTLSYTTPDLTNGNAAEFAGVDNSTDQFVGLDGTVTVTATNASADGTIDIYIETSTDGGTTFPSDAPDFVASEDLTWVASLRINSNGAGYQKATNIKI